MTSEGILALVSIAAALFLAWRGLRSRHLPREELLKMAAIWLAIIAALAAFLHFAGIYPASYNLT